jgi:hypothetical protein
MTNALILTKYTMKIFGHCDAKSNKYVFFCVYEESCHNLSLGLVTKARAYKGAGQK